MDNEYTPNLENLRIIKLLYKTKLSKIWLVQFEEGNAEFYILKGKHLKSLNQFDIDSFKRERKFLETNNSDFFPKFIKAYKDNEYVYLLISFFEGIPLSDIIRENIVILNEFSLENPNEYLEKKEIFLIIAYQLAIMLNYLKNLNYLHRDIKLNNIIINKNLNIYLVDFGFWKNLDNKENKTATLCGTFHSMAPEIFLIDYKNYGLEVDVYSYGVFLYEFFSRNSPFPYFFNEACLDNNIDTNNSNTFCEELNEKTLINNIDPMDFRAKRYYLKYKKNLDFSFDENDELFYSIKEKEDEINIHEKEEQKEILKDEINVFILNLKNLIQSCMKFNPKDRITSDAILKHDLFKGFNYEISFAKYSIVNNLVKSQNTKSDSTINKLLELISYNGEFKEDYALNSKFEDIFDKYF